MSLICRRPNDGNLTVAAVTSARPHRPREKPFLKWSSYLTLCDVKAYRTSMEPQSVGKEGRTFMSRPQVSRQNHQNCDGRHITAGRGRARRPQATRAPIEAGAAASIPCTTLRPISDAPILLLVFSRHVPMTPRAKLSWRLHQAAGALLLA